MRYLDNAKFPSEDEELEKIFMPKGKMQLTYHDSMYPFRIFPQKGLTRLEFEPITILYGGNGSGKTTALNLIAQKLGAKRTSVLSKTFFYEEYLKLVEIEKTKDTYKSCEIVTSDDVFDYLLDIRHLNEGKELKREALGQTYFEKKYELFQLESLADYDELKQRNEIKRKTKSKYIKSEVSKDTRLYSNGESAYQYFTQRITEDGIFILDEPENSLSPKLQMKLVNFLEEAVRFYKCQIIMATHSPFLLSLKEARVYDLDTYPVKARPWQELENVRVYFDFLKKYEEGLDK